MQIFQTLSMFLSVGIMLQTVDAIPVAMKLENQEQSLVKREPIVNAAAGEKAGSWLSRIKWGQVAGGAAVGGLVVGGYNMYKNRANSGATAAADQQQPAAATGVNVPIPTATVAVQG